MKRIAQFLSWVKTEKLAISICFPLCADIASHIYESMPLRLNVRPGGRILRTLLAQ